MGVKVKKQTRSGYVKIVYKKELKFSFIQIINAAFELPDPTDGEACYIRLAAPIEFPADRIAAWDIHIHPLMTSLFVEAGREYPASLRNLCNAAFSPSSRNSHEAAPKHRWQLRNVGGDSETLC